MEPLAVPFDRKRARTTLQTGKAYSVEPHRPVRVCPNKRDPDAEGRYDGVMIRCIRLWTGDDGESHFEVGLIELESGTHGDLLSGKMPVTTVSFQETASGSTLDWHTAPVRQLVITLSGTLDFQTRAKQHFILKPGVVLLAEDTVGGGHSWRLIDAEPWRRIYVVLERGAMVPFKAGAS
jgi:quercetin dioxygenase-like cupin family protein